MPANIFLNYRKDDSRWNTQALYKELLKYFSKGSIFKDFNAIGLGDNYVVSINKALEQCDVLLVIIGKQWLEAKNEQGVRRLWDPTDLVRIEIATALKRDIKVIPVLFDDIKMFKANELPEDLQELTLRQSISVHDTKFDSDIETLAEAINVILGIGPIKKTFKKETPEIKLTSKTRLRTAIVLGLIGLLISVATILVSNASNDKIDTFEEGATITAVGTGIAVLCWFFVGMIIGPNKKRLLLITAGSLFAFGVFVISYKDVMRIDAGIGFTAVTVISLSGLLIAIVIGLIQRLQVNDSNK